MTGSKQADVAFISLMQPDMRALKHEGKANNTMGFHVMRVCYVTIILLPIATHLYR